MDAQLAEIAKLLQDPTTASSILPLLVMITILFFAFLFLLIDLFGRFQLWTWRMNRHESIIVKHADEPNHMERAPQGIWGLFLSFLAPRDPALPQPQTESPQPVRHPVERLEITLASERELNAKTMRKLSELQSELESLNLKNKSLSEELQAERQCRYKNQEQIQTLERQVEQATMELERVYQVASPQKKRPSRKGDK